MTAGVRERESRSLVGRGVRMNCAIWNSPVPHRRFLRNLMAGSRPAPRRTRSFFCRENKSAETEMVRPISVAAALVVAVATRSANAEVGHALRQLSSATVTSDLHYILPDWFNTAKCGLNTYVLRALRPRRTPGARDSASR